MTLLDAIRVLFVHGVGDYVYDVRDREGEGWEGPKVKAWSEACNVLARVQLMDEEFAEKIADILEGGSDAEYVRTCADGVLCQLLKTLGFEKTVDMYDNIDKWYP